MSSLVNPFIFAAGGVTVPNDPSGVSPSDLTGLQLWMKANNTQFNGGAEDAEVSTWNDASGNARNATGVVGATYKPKFRLTDGPNSYPAIRLRTANVGGHFTLPNFLTGYTSGNIFCIVKLDADPPSSGEKCAPTCPWGTHNDAYYPFTDGKIYDDFGSNARKNSITTGVSLASWRCYEVRTASAAWSCHLDGTQKHTTATNTVAWLPTPRIGFNDAPATDRYMNGLVAEIIFYNSVLSSTDRFNTVHTYLNNKYALGLPTS